MDARTQSSLQSPLWSHSDQSKEKNSKVGAAHTIRPLISSLISNERKLIFVMEIREIKRGRS